MRVTPQQWQEATVRRPSRQGGRSEPRGVSTVPGLHPVLSHLEPLSFSPRLRSRPWGPLDRNHRRMRHVSWKLQPLQEERLPPGRVHGPRPSATCPPPHTFEPSPPHLAPWGPALSAELAPSSKNLQRPRVHRRLWLKGSMYQVKRKPP